MAFGQTRGGDANKFGISPQFLDGSGAAVAHRASQSAHQLECGIGKGAFIRHAAFNAFGNQFLGIFLEVAV